MTVKELMTGYTPNPSFEGVLTTDDLVFAIDLTKEGTDPKTYTVLQVGISGIDARLTADTVDSNYIRAGKSSTKTGTQRNIKVTGDRFIGDDAQDALFGIDNVYAAGQDAVFPGVLFNLKTGKGEKADYTCVVNSDGGGTAGANATIDVDFKKVGDKPEEYTYSATE